MCVLCLEGVILDYAVVYHAESFVVHLIWQHFVYDWLDSQGSFWKLGVMLFFYFLGILLFTFLGI
jgi:hypothetical protein